MTERCSLADFLVEGGPRRVPFQLCCLIGLIERDGDRLGCAAGLGPEAGLIPVAAPEKAGSAAAP